MAQPVTAKFGTFIISLGSSAEPPVFTAPCGFTSKALALSKNLSEVNIPDCDDPDAAFWVARDVQSLTAAVTGDGLLAAESVPTWQAAWDTTESVPVQIEIEFTTGTLAYTGLMHLESWNLGAESGGRVTSAISMQSDGELVGELDGGAVSRDGSVTLDWADNTYRFRLAWAQLIELQDATEAGPAMVLKRLMDGTWRVTDISATIRLGLIGGGLEPVPALKLVRSYVEARPPMESLVFAQAILSVALLGSAEDEPKKSDAEEPSMSTTYPTAAFATPPLSAPVPQ